MEQTDTEGRAYERTFKEYSTLYSTLCGAVQDGQTLTNVKNIRGQTENIYNLCNYLFPLVDAVKLLAPCDSLKLFKAVIRGL